MGQGTSAAGGSGAETHREASLGAWESTAIGSCGWWEIPGCLSGGGGGGGVLKEGHSSGLWGGQAGPKGERRKEAEGREGKGRGCLGPAESRGAETSQAHAAFHSEAGIAVTAGSEAGRGRLTLGLRNTSMTAGAPSLSPSLPGGLCWGRGTRQVLGQPGGLS